MQHHGGAQRRARRLVRRWVTGLTLMAGLILAPAGLRAGPSDENLDDVPFSHFLADAGVSASQFEPFREWDSELTADEATTLEQILFRFDQFNAAQLAKSVPGASDGQAPQPGEIWRLDGSVESVSRVPLPEGAPEELHRSGLFRCELVATGNDNAELRVTILTPRIPTAWQRGLEGEKLAEPASLQGVVLGSLAGDKAEHRLVVTNRIKWRPTLGIPAGTAWLAARGFDAGLLDDVRQHRPFAKPNESSEAVAFYSALATLAAGDPAEINRLAKSAVAAEAVRRQAIAASAADRLRTLAIDLETARHEQRKSIEAEIAVLRRQQSTATHIQKRARQGLSSVVPLFNEPAESVGHFFVIEGIARRAVRIAVGEPGSESSVVPGVSPLTAYYELDVFPNDAQNNPVICCVARLPAGFPTGDVIRQPVRVSGIFFKKWLYARRPDGESADPATPSRIAPPLMLAVEPQWLQTTAAPRGNRGLWAGLAILGVGVAVWLVMLRTSRRDRLARQRLARYDEPLDNLLED